ncbi:MAG: hypothetical protein AAB250_07835 [Bdellovibrionota bacterium]
MAQNAMNTQNVSNVGDILKDSIASAMGDVVQALGPQINELATKYAQQAVDKSRVVALGAVKRVRAQPWFLVGIAAVLLVGAAMMIGFKNVDREEVLH